MDDRSWMYRRKDDEGYLHIEFLNGLGRFIQYACSQPAFMDGEKIRCPCSKCKNRAYAEVQTVKLHLVKNGFLTDYFIWNRHGESTGIQSNSFEQGQHSGSNTAPEFFNNYQHMIYDAAGPRLQSMMPEENPNAVDQRFFDMLAAADRPLWEGCKKVSEMSVVGRLANIKSVSSMSVPSFDMVCQLINDCIPEENCMVQDFYNTTKLVEGLGLPVQKIDCCRKGCMLYWGVDEDKVQCPVCESPRFKTTSRSVIPYKRMWFFPLTPRLKRLYASEKTAASMRWHADHGHSDSGVMCHPCDSEAWKHFNNLHTDFASEGRNVRLGLCTDGFQPFGQSGQQYSCWPIIITPYNLPPTMCMKEPYMFLTALVPGPNNPKHKIDVFLQPVIAELQLLWEDGVDTYDVSLKQNFTLRAALMWTISDFPAFSMLSGWGTAGKTACPYCMEDTKSFRLTNGGKQSWFDCHRRFLPEHHPFRRNRRKFTKNRIEHDGPPEMMTGSDMKHTIDQYGFLRMTDEDAETTNKNLSKYCGWRKKSIFWDLPYWETNLIRHNLDVMHIEKNVFDNVFNTVMDIPGKSKDNAKARADLMMICNRPELEIRNERYAQAAYTLSRNQKEIICQWVKELKFPDGYVSDLGKCVDMKKLKMFGMKSHDCHVFMQRLLPIALRKMLPPNVWEAITELSVFFRNLTATTITRDDMEKLETCIPLILCKLEMIFVPGFFDSMEHLPVHLPFEAKLAGPVQYRWMYPFERYLRVLKKSVKQKAYVEGSICNAYLMREASAFCSYYFEPHVYTRERQPTRNDVGDAGTDNNDGNLVIFTYPGRLKGKKNVRFWEQAEFDAVHSYILLNCSEVQPFISIFEASCRAHNPHLSDNEIAEQLYEDFSDWFYNYARMNIIDNQYIAHLARKPVRSVTSYPIYFINGYKFHAESYGRNHSTINSGVTIAGGYGNYYGIVKEILEVEYPALPIKRTVVFKCEWFDPTINVGVKINDAYKLVDVNIRRRFNRFEPFILAMQAIQVCYVPYPSVGNAPSDWRAVCKVKARGWIEVQEKSDAESDEQSVPFQANEIEDLTITHVDYTVSLAADNGQEVNISNDASDESDSPILETSSSNEEILLKSSNDICSDSE